MGASGSVNKTKINQTVTNDIMQASTQYCTIASTQSFSGNTLFFIGGTGDVSIVQTSTLSNVNCNMSNVLDSQVLTILESMSKQDINVSTGPTGTLNYTKNKTSIYLTTSNTITQLMSSTCNITSDQNIDNNYIFAQDQKGDFLFSQDSEITGATCTMGNAAKSVTDNEQIADADQSTTLRNVFGIFLAIIALGFILVIVVVLALVFGGHKGSSGTTEAVTPDYASAFINANKNSSANLDSTISSLNKLQTTAPKSTTSTSSSTINALTAAATGVATQAATAYITSAK